MRNYNYKQYNCILACVSYFLDENPETLIQELGHDGQEIELCLCSCSDEVLFNPEHKHPDTCRRGYHIQEFYPSLFRRSRLPVLISKELSIINYRNDVPCYISNDKFFLEKLNSPDTCIILGWFDGAGHAVLKVGDSYIINPKDNFKSKRSIKEMIGSNIQNLHHLILIY